MGERGPQKQDREMGCMGAEDPLSTRNQSSRPRLPPHQPERRPVATDPVAFERLEAMALVQRRVPRVGVLEVGGDAAAVAALERMAQQSAADPTTLMGRGDSQLEQVEVGPLRMPRLESRHRWQYAGQTAGPDGSHEAQRLSELSEPSRAPPPLRSE